MRSKLLPIFFVVLVDVFGLTLVIPLLAIYAEHFSATPLDATLLVSIYAAFQLFSGPILGRLSDRYGRKPLLLVSQAGTFLSFLLMARANSLLVLFVARALDGATAGNLSIAQAYISDNTEPAERAKSFALIGIAFGLGFFIGPFLSGWLSASHGLAAPIWLAAALSATSIVATLTLLPSGKPAERQPTSGPASGAPTAPRVSLFEFGVYRDMLGRPVLGGLLLQSVAYIVSFGIFTSGFALYAERTYQWHGRPFGIREVGYVFAFVGFLGIGLQGGLIGRLVRRLGEPKMVSSGFIALIIGYIGLAMAHSVSALLTVATINAYGNAVLRPVLNSLISQAAGRHEQGTALGINQSLSSIGQIFAPMLAGALIERRMLAGWALAAAVSAAIGLALVRIGSGRLPNGKSPPHGGEPTAGRA
jgi:DHA1 family tetracycline resistance protein-like MFS transporter